jgi:hypothetical protein
MNLNEQISRIHELMGSNKRTLNEGRIFITPDEKEKLNDIIGKTALVVTGPDIDPSEKKYVGEINYKYADGKDAVVYFFVSNDSPGLYGYYRAHDLKNPDDNIIVIQQKPFKIMLTGIEKKYKDLTGDSEAGINSLTSTIKHEFLHAKDPNVNEYKTKIPYSTSDEKLYFSSWFEFEAMTGDFFDSLVSKIEETINIDSPREKKDKVKVVLDDLLDFYSGKEKKLSKETYDFLQGTQSRNILQSILKFVERTVDKIIDLGISNNLLDKHNFFIDKIKEYNPDGFKEFTKDLYKIIDAVKDRYKL